MPRPFNEQEQDYTATAKVITLSGSEEYDVDVLDNPVRAKLNPALAYANMYTWRHFGGFSG